MANETLSPKQASEIINKCSTILEEVENQVTRKSEEFLLDLSKSWEDEHAVEFAGILQKTVSDTISSLNSNMQKLADQVKSIAESYGKVGGNAVSINAVLMKKAPEINISMVQNTFVDGESGDEFGFRNPSADPENLLSSFTQLKSFLSQVSSDAVSQIKSINAFGNDAVKANLAKSGGKVVTILENAVDTLKGGLNQSITDTMNDYIAVGGSAISAADLIGDADKFKNFIGETHISTLYGGPSQVGNNIVFEKIGDQIGNPSTKYGGVCKPDNLSSVISENIGDQIGNPSTKYGGVCKNDNLSSVISEKIGDQIGNPSTKYGGVCKNDNFSSVISGKVDH